MAEKKRIVAKNAKELAEVMGLEPADAVEWEMRASLTNKIVDTVRRRRRSVTQVAKESKTSRARITRILKGDTQGISIEVLLRVLGAVGHTVKLTFQKVA